MSTGEGRPSLNVHLSDIMDYRCQCGGRIHKSVDGAVPQNIHCDTCSAVYEPYPQLICVETAVNPSVQVGQPAQVQWKALQQAGQGGG